MSQLKLPGLTVVYIIFICIIFVSISAIPSLFNQKENERSKQVIQQIEQALQEENQQEKITKLKQMVDKEDVDLVVIQKEEALYATLPIQDFDLLDKMVEKRSLSYYSRYQVEADGQAYQIWLAIYQPSVQNFFEYLIIYFSVFIVILFTIIILIISKMTKNVVKPLERLKNNILKLKDFRLKEVASQKQLTEYDGLLYELSEFSDELQGKMDDIGIRYTGLERELQEKQERMIYKDQLIGSLVHDLKNPLTMTAMKLEQMSLDYEGQEDLATDIKLLRKKNHETLRDIQTTIKMVHSENVEPDVVTINLVDLMQETLQRFKPIFKAKKIFMDLDVPREVYVEMDLIEAKQLFHNIVSNVAQYTKEKGHFSVSIFETEQEIRIEVYNESAHTHEIAFDQVFDLFYHHALEENKYGTGIGMYTIKAMIEKYQGSCQFEPRDDGVVLLLTLPRTV